MENAKDKNKKVNLTMKLDGELADLIVNQYEDQRKEGEPFKGEFIGQVFAQALGKASETDGSTTAQNGWKEINRKTQEKLKWYKILLIITLAFFVLLLFLYRRSISYA